MPNVFREQANDRFHRSLAFLNKAETLLQDDLVNRSALADAVSAIKNMLQGYLLLCVSRAPESAVTQRWQEIAASNGMPDLLQACGEAGLDLRGLAVEIKGLNRERNRRMHDDPSQRIETQQARHALELARKVQGRIKAAVQGNAVVAEPEPAQSGPARLAAVARAAVTGQLGRSSTAHGAPAPVAAQQAAAGAADSLAASQLDMMPVQATGDGVKPAGDGVDTSLKEVSSASMMEPQPDATPDAEPVVAPDNGDTFIPDETESGDDSGDTQLLAAVIPGAPAHQRRGGLVLARALLFAAVLILGIIAGAGLMLPVATGHAPGWLAFATQYLPATPTATAIPTATATLTPSGPYAAGSLIVVPTCASGGPAVTLTNSGAQPVRWSIGSPDDAGVLFALPGTHAGAAAPSQAGVLKGSASVTVLVSGAASGANAIVVIASTGTVQLPAPTC